jgi:hypothetical protein
MSEQLRHHVVAQARWCWNELQFHIDAIYHLGLATREQVSSSLPSAPVELLAPPVVMDTDQQVSTPAPRGQPLTQRVTIGDAMTFYTLSSRDVKVILMRL